jgi:hypothetical protein
VKKAVSSRNLDVCTAGGTEGVLALSGVDFIARTRMGAVKQNLAQGHAREVGQVELTNPLSAFWQGLEVKQGQAFNGTIRCDEDCFENDSVQIRIKVVLRHERQSACAVMLLDLVQFDVEGGGGRRSALRGLRE